MKTQFNSERQSTAYQFTVNMINGKVAPEHQAAIDGLKLVVKMGNLAYDTDAPQRVKLQGRGPRADISEKVKGYRRGYDCSLPLTYATHADVYVYAR